MHHAVAVKWVVALYRLKEWVLGVTEVDAVEVVRYFSDYLHVPCVIFVVLWAPHAGPVWVVILGW
jgi:hypothetical protein